MTNLVAVEASPVATVTEQQMEKTLKVAKRTLVQQLSDRNSELKDKAAELRKSARGVIDKLAKTMEEKARKAAYRGDYGILELVDAYNDFVAAGPDGNTEWCGDISEIVQSVDAVSRNYWDRLTDPALLLDAADCFRVHVTLGLGHLNAWGDEDSDMDAISRRVGISMNSVETTKFRRYEKLYAEERGVKEEIEENNRKIGEVDKLIQQMETKLLTDQLRSTAEGEKFLSTVMTYLGNFLETGECINLLEEAK